MEVSFGHLVHRFGPQVQERQLYIVEAFPEIAAGGYDIDIAGGSIRFRATGRQVPVQMIGTEGGGQWIWAHENPSFGDDVVRLSLQLVAIGEQHGERAFQVAGFDLPEWQPGQLLSGMSCAVIAAGIGDAAGIYCVHDRSRDARLWVALVDDAMKEPPGVHPIDRIVMRFPKILALAAVHPHDGGVTLTDWVLALDGYCRSLGVDGAMDGDDVVLAAGGKTARARFADGAVSIAAEI